MSQFLTFQKFETGDEARDIARILQEAGIPVALEVVPPALISPVITGIQQPDEVLLKIPSLYFNQARDVLIAAFPARLEDTHPDHPLFSLTDEELREVVAKPEEWGLDNYQLAQLILDQRGAGLPPEQIEQLKQQHLKILAAAEPADGYWITSGYLIALLWLGTEIWFLVNGSLFLLFGLPLLLPVILGRYIVVAKKTLPNGQRVRTFTPGSRKHGFILLGISLLALALFLFQVFVSGAVPVMQWSELFPK